MSFDWTEFDNKFKAALTKAGADTPCARCGKSSYEILHGFFRHPLHERFDEGAVSAGDVITAVLVCKNCGWMAEHVLQMIGLGRFAKAWQGEERIFDVS
jgi:hypothetical protein